MQLFSRLIAALAAVMLMMSPAVASQILPAAASPHCDGTAGTASHHESRAASSLACCVATVASVAPATTGFEVLAVAQRIVVLPGGDDRVPGGNWGTDPPPPRAH